MHGARVSLGLLLLTAGLSTAGCFSPNESSILETDSGGAADETAATESTPPETMTSGPTDPTPGTDPSDTMPPDTDPSDTTPPDTDPSDTDPSDTDPSDTDPSDTDPSDTDPTDTGGPNCGDSNEDPDEECDDGNDVNGDGCNNNCIVSGSVLWERTYNDSEDDQARSLAVNSQDEILIVAHTGANNNRVCSDWMRLYDTDGSPIQTDQTPVDYCYVDFTGDDEIAGFRSTSFENNGSRFPGEFALASHTLTGQQVWAQDLDYFRMIRRPKADASGLFGGGMVGQDSGSIYYQSTGFTVAMADGSVAWEQGIPTPVPSPSPPFASHSCGPVAIDGAGNRFSLCVLEGEDMLIYKHSSAGVLAWNAPASPTNEFADAIDCVLATGPDGEVVLGCEDEVIVYDLNGSETDRFSYSGPGGTTIWDIVVASDGDITIAGVQDNESNADVTDIFVRKSAADGTLRWLLAQEDAGGEVSLGLLSDDSMAVLGDVTDGGSGRDIWLTRIAP